MLEEFKIVQYHKDNLPLNLEDTEFKIHDLQRLPTARRNNIQRPEITLERQRLFEEEYYITIIISYDCVSFLKFSI